MSLVAYNYARALKENFKKEQEEDFFSFLKELKELKKVLDLSEIKAFFISPVIPVKEKKEGLKKIFEKFTFDKLICSFLLFLLDKKRWKELNAILACLTDIENQMKGVLLAEVESVEPLSPDLQKSLEKTLEGFFGKKIFLTEKKASQKIIGGLRVRAQGFIFDDTLLFHLTQMKNQIRRNFHDYTS
ncbi:MAG: ATP synthase F1 subunit delta [Bdellovibrionales bacterium]|nr:ATP synthase F1 subunit delta [Bdellovibrionales bacterium]